MTRSSRLSRFVIVGLGGFLVQMGTAASLLGLGLAPVLATLVAIEAAIVHNHAWHRRWGWRERAALLPWWQTLLRAHAGVGASSLAIGVGMVAVLDGRMPPLAAQCLAVAACAAVNFVLADRWVFAPRALVGSASAATMSKRIAMTALAAVLCAARASAADAGPSAEAVRGWQRYGAALAKIRTADGQRGVPSWATDDDRQGTVTLTALRRGALVVGRRSLDVEVDGATLEHWQGSVLLRGVTLAQVAHRLRHPEAYPQPPDVRALKVTAHTEAGHELYLRLTRSMIVSATYDTWHHVRHAPPTADRLESVSESSRIQEVDDPGSARERRLAPDEGRGFLWRMQSSWRFTAVDGGVVVTCESITLSRPVPFGLGLVSRPAITRVARESMSTAVGAWRRGWTSTPTAD
ncbi:MAG TPA: GtrA family protein [Luteitalea sp.]|nr:GtrA family protein [Luteitalea sp.]